MRKESVASVSVIIFALHVHPSFPALHLKYSWCPVFNKREHDAHT